MQTLLAAAIVTGHLWVSLPADPTNVISFTKEFDSMADCEKESVEVTERILQRIPGAKVLTDCVFTGPTA